MMPLSQVSELVVIETKTYVVLEGRVGTRVVWAWCELKAGSPGFKEVTYTTPDGMGAPDLESAPAKLDRHLFTVTVPAEED